MYVNYFAVWGPIFVVAMNSRPLAYRVSPTESSWMIPGTYDEEHEEEVEAWRRTRCGCR